MKGTETVKKEEPKGRIWACIGYEESLIKNWLEMLELLHIPCYVSPIHDKDGVKPHYHIMFLFDGQKKQSQVKDIMTSFGGVGCELVQSKTAYLRYLCHLDSDGKAKYDVNNVRSLNGSKSYLEAIEDKTSSRYEILAEMVNYARKNRVSYAGLVDFAFKNQRYDWIKVLDANSRLISEYLRCYRYSQC